MLFVCKIMGTWKMLADKWAVFGAISLAGCISMQLWAPQAIIIGASGVQVRMGNTESGRKL